MSARRALAVLAVSCSVIAAPPDRAAPGDGSPQVRIAHSPTVSGDAAHLLARPIGQLHLESDNSHDALGQIAWLLGVEVAVDARAASGLAEYGEQTLDTRGGDGADLLEIAVGLVPRVEGSRVVLHRREDTRTTDSPCEFVTAIPRDKLNTTIARGRVVTADGRGIGGACVAAEGYPPGRTDATGQFSCRVPRVGAPVIAWMAGRAPAEAVLSSSRELELRIGPPVARLEVRAVGTGGAVLGGLLVHCGASLEMASQGPRRGDWHVRFDGLRDGRFPLVVATRGHGATRCSAPVRIGETTAVAARLTPSTLAARLRDERGSVQARDIRLTVALWKLAQSAALPLQFEASLGEAGRRTVSIDRKDAPLAEILDDLCAAAAATWRVDEPAWLVRIDKK